MHKKIFRKKELVTAFLYLEVAMIFLLLWQFYHFLGLKIINGELKIFQNVISELEVYLFLINAALFTLLYFRIALNDKNVMQVHNEFSKVILGKTKEKIFGVEKQIIIFLIVQFAFAFIIAIAITFYLDPDISFPGFEKVAFPFNLIAFVVFVAVGFYLFSKTKPFRDEVYDEGFLQKKLMPAHRLFSTKRITNKKTGTIRIKNSKK